jgi:D-alanyl-D-alanine carboxypeptidase (penicillin-binding protein 5/6)
MLNSAYKDYYCKYVKGGKTGTTSKAGRCMAAYASKDGYNYICIALNSTFYDVDKDGVNENGAFLDCKEMLEWTYQNIELVPICDINQVVAQLPVKYAKNTDYVTLSPEETVYSLVPKGTDSSSLLVEIVEGTAPEILKAPVKKGDVVCRGRVLYAGNVIKEINLISNTDAKMSIFSFIGSTAKSIFSSWIFRIIAILVIAALVILVIKKKNNGSGGSKKKKGYQILNYNDFIKTK